MKVILETTYESATPHEAIIKQGRLRFEMIQSLDLRFDSDELNRSEDGTLVSHQETFLNKTNRLDLFRIYPQPSRPVVSDWYDQIIPGLRDKIVVEADNLLVQKVTYFFCERGYQHDPK